MVTFLAHLPTISEIILTCGVSQWPTYWKNAQAEINDELLNYFHTFSRPDIIYQVHLKFTLKFFHSLCKLSCFNKIYV